MSVDTKEIIALIAMLNNKRSDNYQEWITIGLIIKAYSNDYNLFEMFSKKSNKFDSKECRQKWDQLPASKLR